MKSNLLKTFTISVLLGAPAAHAQIQLSHDYVNEHSDSIGTFQGILFREGGFSTLYPIPNTDGKEFWTCSDRGVNIDCAEANPSACHPTYDKLFAFPDYAPKIHRIKLAGDSIHILQSITMKRPDGTDARGVLNPEGFGSTADEQASTDTVTDCADFNTRIAPKDEWALDPEGLVMDAEGNFWVSEENGPTIWKMDPNGVVLKRYTPYADQPGASNIDIAIDTVFKYRKNNRGFESLAQTPNGKIYTIIQSPILYPTKDAGEESRVHRILEIDPQTNTTKMYAYLNEGPNGSGDNKIRKRDWKIGDMAAINDSTFLLIEAGLRGSNDQKKIYLINIKNATPIHSGLYNGKTVEELEDSTGLAENNITPVQKTLFLDLNANGWPVSLEKSEGLAILNDSMIAVGNDNDFGQISPEENGIATATGILSHVFLYDLKGANKIPGYPVVPAGIAQNGNTINNVAIYPNPASSQVFIQFTQIKPQPATVNLLDVTGRLIKHQILSPTGNGKQELQLNILDVANGLYFIELNAGMYKQLQKIIIRH